MANKMKQWRREAFKHNSDRTRELQASGDIPFGVRVRHQGRKFKSNVGSQWMKGAMTPLLAALFSRVGLLNTTAPTV